MSEVEVWVPVPLDDEKLRRLYQVSNLGRVRSLKGKGWYILKGRTQSRNDHVPYPNVVIGGKKKYIHRLVCRAFHGPAPEGQPLALHRDGDPLNMRESNLRWGSQSDNQMDWLRHHSRVRTSMLSEQEVLQIRQLYRRNSMKLNELAKLFNISGKTVREIITYKTWKHIP